MYQSKIGFELLAVALAFVGVASSRACADDPFATLQSVDDTVLQDVETRPDDWLSHGRDTGETRFSPIADINVDNVRELGLAWSYDTDTTRGLEATPLVVDGVIYTTGSWSIVYAIDARTGKELWKYDPEVEGKFGAKACCDVVNRGVAVYRGRVYVGALDGRLIALDCETGKPIWQATTVDQERPYTITGAPRIANGKVLIGNGGAEFGVRGYVSAYDWESGKLVWRFYTVPGDPSLGFESPAMEQAAKTWSGQWWEIGGGGTCWDSIAFDPQLNLVYVGVGNGSPWNPKLRGDGSGGDNLYLSSIVALNADTGKLIWHYQTTPAEAWDFTATQHMILTELSIDGRQRKVIMQAPKNGFFYVLDRETGEFISAEAYVKVTWAEGVDPQTGRPIDVPGARYEDEGFLVLPGPLGGHNWQPMSYSPKTGLVYLPAQDNSLFFMQPENFEYRKGSASVGIGSLPGSKKTQFSGFLLAWDPVAQKERWRKPYSMMWNGGTLATAGNLVFQGTADGRFIAYHAETGESLWEINIGSGIIATPITYRVDGVQYVSIMAGWGGAGAGTGGLTTQASGRLLNFVLRGQMQLPTLATQETPLKVSVIASDRDAESARRGQLEYATSCRVCHGDPTRRGQALPSLAFSDESIFDQYDDIVYEGELIDNGMPGFKQWLTKDQIADIRHYLITQRNQLATSDTD